MASQDLIYSVLSRPLGNGISSVKHGVKQVSETTKLKPFAEEDDTIEQYDGNERRKSRRERRNIIGRRHKKSKDDEQEGGLDLYA